MHSLSCIAPYWNWQVEVTIIACLLWECCLSQYISGTVLSPPGHFLRRMMVLTVLELSDLSSFWDLKSAMKNLRNIIQENVTCRNYIRAIQQWCSCLVCSATLPPHLYTLLKQIRFQIFHPKFMLMLQSMPLCLSSHRSLTSSVNTTSSCSIATLSPSFVASTTSMLKFSLAWIWMTLQYGEWKKYAIALPFLGVLSKLEHYHLCLRSMKNL